MPISQCSNEPILPDTWHGTTILTVRKGGKVVIAGDGQVTLGQTIVKGNAKKVRSVGNGNVIAGFAGATADAFTLFERLETKLERFPDQLKRACVELAKDWRTDRYLRHLEAMMIVADADESLVLTGKGDVLEPDDNVMGIGSGGNYALAAARALLDSDLDAEAIARKAMAIAADICVYTNNQVVIESLIEDMMMKMQRATPYPLPNGERSREACFARVRGSEDTSKAPSPNTLPGERGSVPRQGNHDLILTTRDRFRARPPHRRPARRQARRRHCAPQPLAPPAARR